MSKFISPIIALVVVIISQAFDSKNGVEMASVMYLILYYIVCLATDKFLEEK